MSANPTEEVEMERMSGRRRSALLLAAALACLAGLLSTSAQAQGVTRDQLEAQGWTCFVPPTVPDWIVCFNPGLGRPFPGNPDPRPSYTFLAFDRTSGEFIHTGHLIRQDLYRGQPCAPGREPYVFRALIGYYECVRG
jgi:hypothetical protein